MWVHTVHIGQIQASARNRRGLEDVFQELKPPFFHKLKICATNYVVSRGWNISEGFSDIFGGLKHFWRGFPLYHPPRRTPCTGYEVRCLTFRFEASDLFFRPPLRMPVTSRISVSVEEFQRAHSKSPTLETRDWSSDVNMENSIIELIVRELNHRPSICSILYHP